MSQRKHSAVLRGDVLQDMATGQKYMLHPTDDDRQKGIWEYNEEADGHRWHYIIVSDVTYALSCYLDWEEEMEEWCQETMGQGPFGNRLSEEELFMKGVDDVLFGLQCHLEAAYFSTISSHVAKQAVNNCCKPGLLSCTVAGSAKSLCISSIRVGNCSKTWQISSHVGILDF